MEIRLKIYEFFFSSSLTFNEIQSAYDCVSVFNNSAIECVDLMKFVMNCVFGIH